MIKLHPRQSDCARHTYEQGNASTLNFTSLIAPSICALMHTKRVKTDATIFKPRCSRTGMCYRLDRVQALPLVWTRFLRLAICSPMVARSPARWSCDGRETSGKTSGEMSRVMPAQCPDNGRSVATAMPPNVRQDDSQDNLPCARLGRAMSAPETCETTRNTSAQQRAAVRATAKATSRKRLVEIPSSAFNHDIPKL
jgi:hypothetical protein